jgi:predicted outer membrane repeat protein
MMQIDQGLKEKYGSICTSLNDIEFGSILKPEVSLQNLIDDAKDKGTIHIPAGYYYLDKSLQITKNLTAIGDGLVVLDAHKAFEILNITNSNAIVRLENIGLVNGKGNYGGAIDSKAKSLELVNCAFSNNLANYGAGVYQNEGRLFIENSTFNHNYAASKGGAVYANASVMNSPTITLKGCKFYRNNVTNIGAAICVEHKDLSIESSDLSGNGGTAALYASNSSVLLRDCNVSNNLGPNNMRQAGRGGGVRFDNCSAIIENCTIQGNKATYLDDEGLFTPEYWGWGGEGGGMYLLHSNVTINDTYVDDNEAFFSGGIYVVLSNLMVNRGGISNNTARYVVTSEETFCGNFGGMLILGGQATLNDVFMDNNHADNLSGAIYNSGGRLNLIGKTNMSGNTASEGAGISNGGILTIDGDVIVSNNTADNGAGIHNLKSGSVEICGDAQLIDNQAKEKGGAIYNEGNLSISGIAISGNNATYGSAIYNDGNLTLTDSEIKDNKAYIGGSIWNTNRMMMAGVKMDETGGNASLSSVS